MNYSSKKKQLIESELKRLEPYCLVERNGEDVAVPISELTDEELAIRIGKLNALAKLNKMNAQELREFNEGKS